MNCRFVIVIVVLLFVQSVFAQEQVGSSSDSKNNNSIELSVDFDYASSLNNVFLQKIAFGGFVSQDIIDDNFNRLATDNNVIGNTADVGLFYKRNIEQLSGVEGLAYGFALQYHQIMDANYSADVYSLIMDGNKQFVGENANLNNTNFYSMQYYQIKAGLSKYNEQNNTEFGFRLALNLGSQFLNVETPNGELYTEIDGKEISLNGDLNYLKSEDFNNDLASIQGFGLAIDLYYHKDVAQKYNYGIEISDIGYIKWNDKSESYNSTEGLSFSGVEIDNVFDIPGDILPSSFDDTLSNFIAENGSVESFSIIIPMTINLWYEHFINNSFSAEAGFTAKVFSSYKPNYKIGANYYINKNYKIGANVNYGGYAKLNVGLSFGAEISDNLEVNIQTRYFSGIIAQQFSGYGGFAQIEYKF